VFVVASRAWLLYVMRAASACLGGCFHSGGARLFQVAAFMLLSVVFALLLLVHLLFTHLQCSGLDVGMHTEPEMSELHV
jgi:hypothetical protein